MFSKLKGLNPAPLSEVFGVQTLDEALVHDLYFISPHTSPRIQTGLTAEHNTLQQERSTNEGYRKDMKSKLRNEQHEREQEQTHHVAMLRELQHMLGREIHFGAS